MSTVSPPEPSANSSLETTINYKVTTGYVVYTVAVAPDTTVLQFKMKLSNQCGIVHRYLQLYYKGIPMENDRNMNTYSHTTCISLSVIRRYYSD